MSLPRARDDRLLLIVFGPGTGELALVRAPGNHWMVIDGCRKQGTFSYAQRALAHYSAQPELIILTHPHRDHSGGVADLIEERTAGPTSEWPTLAMLPPPDLRPALGPAYTPAAHAQGVAERAIAAIEERWSRHPLCRWDLPLGDTRSLGPAKLTVLSPVPVPTRSTRLDPNHLATALLVEWETVRIVLGADLEPASAWARVLGREPSASHHAGLKVPHHGSLAAIHDPLLKPSPSALRIATPFASGELPRFDHAGGVAHLHKTGAEVHLTGLPRAYSGQGGLGGQRIPRAKLAANARSLRLDPPVTGFPDCFVAIEWDVAASPTLSHGAGSVIVTK